MWCLRLKSKPVNCHPLTSCPVWTGVDRGRRGWGQPEARLGGDWVQQLGHLLPGPGYYITSAHRSRFFTWSQYFITPGESWVMGPDFSLGPFISSWCCIKLAGRGWAGQSGRGLATGDWRAKETWSPASCSIFPTFSKNNKCLLWTAF